MILLPKGVFTLEEDLLIKNIDDQQRELNKLARTLQQLMQEVVIAKTSFGFFKWMLMEKQTKQEDEHLAFEELTMHAHLQSAILGLAKVADISADKQTLSLWKLLGGLKRVLDSQRYQGPVTSSRIQGAQLHFFLGRAEHHLKEIGSDQKKLESVKYEYSNIVDLRNKAFAHIDKKSVNDKQSLVKQTTSRPNDVDKLTEELYRMVIKYQKALHGENRQHVFDTSALNSKVAMQCVSEFREWEDKWRLPERMR